MNAILIDILSVVAIVSRLLVITARRPVMSILFLISVFVSVAGYLVILGLGFIGLVYLIVYVGAIAILFLFVVMMLNLQLSEITRVGSEYTQNIPIGLLLSIVFFTEMANILPIGTNGLKGFIS